MGLCLKLLLWLELLCLGLELLLLELLLRLRLELLLLRLELRLRWSPSRLRPVVAAGGTEEVAECSLDSGEESPLL